MNIRNVVHRGLRRFIQRNDPSGLPRAVGEKLRNTLTFLQEMENTQELHKIANWKAHQLTGDRKGTWSLAVTRNWRMTFKIDQTPGEVFDLDFEDYR